ncbi:hypothetical protein [Pararhodobacter oceanensis]|uniref:hypothetical protein n=1 Tax=Pararhodobacter oceanensis TaxID=2172121 RepID=UPI003A9531CB
MQMPIDTSEDLTEMAAACYPLARVAITAIKNDVLELIADEHRESAQALLMNLEHGDTFKTANLDLLPALRKYSHGITSPKTEAARVNRAT